MWIDYVWGYKLFGDLYETVRVKFQSPEMDELDNVFVKEADAQKAVEVLNHKPEPEDTLLHTYAMGRLLIEMVQGEQAVYSILAPLQGQGSDYDGSDESFENKLLLRAKTACLIRFDRRVTKNPRNLSLAAIL
ncbi:hypothetical protein Peetri_00084 [Pseudomonas phage vB_PpuM-Peetri]